MINILVFKKKKEKNKPVVVLPFFSSFPSPTTVQFLVWLLLSPKEQKSPLVFSHAENKK